MASDDSQSASPYHNGFKVFGSNGNYDSWQQNLGDWEKFQIYIPDSGGVKNSACNYLGAALILSPFHDKYIQCTTDNYLCYRKTRVGVSDLHLCESAFYLSYAVVE